MAKLTPKQQAFVDEYLISLNATQAAIKAGYSPKTARQIGEQNLSKLDIKRAISDAQQKRIQRTQVTQDEVISGLLLEAKREGEGTSHAARVSAWTQLGRHLGMFTDKMESTSKVEVSTLSQMMDELSNET